MARPKKNQLIKDYSRYCASCPDSDECHYRLTDGTNCTASICYPSRGHPIRFCTEHWPICKFCNKKLPTFNTGRLKHHCDCEQVNLLYETATQAGKNRRIWKELIQNAFTPLGINLEWNITGDYYTMVLNKKTPPVWIGACYAFIDNPDKDMISIRDPHGRIIEPPINIADPAFGHHIVERVFDAIAGLQLRQRVATCDSHITLYGDKIPWELAGINLLGPKDPKYAGILERYQLGINQALAALREGLEVIKSNASGHGEFAQQVLDRELDAESSGATGGI